jgi:hypothetical protein
MLYHLSEAQRRALVIADNRLALNAGWDEEMLRIELAALQEVDFNLDLTGFAEEELARLLAEQQALVGLPDPRGVLVAALGKLREDRRFRVGLVMVDAVGIGYHVAMHLADQSYQVFGFNAGGAAVDSEHFVNAKAEAY